MYLALLLLLAFSAFFSASETALSSVNRIRMKNKADDGDKKAQRVLGLPMITTGRCPPFSSATMW